MPQLERLGASGASLDGVSSTVFTDLERALGSTRLGELQRAGSGGSASVSLLGIVTPHGLALLAEIAASALGFLRERGQVLASRCITAALVAYPAVHAAWVLVRASLSDFVAPGIGVVSLLAADAIVAVVLVRHSAAGRTSSRALRLRRLRARLATEMPLAVGPEQDAPPT